MDGTNTGACSEHQLCICQFMEPDWYLFGPGGIVAFASVVVLAYAYKKHLRRTRGMVDGRVAMSDFADKSGAYMLAVTLTLGIAGLVGAPVLSSQRLQAM
mmetsp:Transcript_81114/g.234566  ORF Transcript_81114/g.234566 Transcript_81114/m.234566 type:complete len:100 (+) Transcript_81114:58-357(+)